MAYEAHGRPETGLRGATVVLTGAAGGIGRRAVQRFLSEGADVIAVDRNESSLAGLCAESGRTDRLTPRCVDVSDPDACAQLAADLTTRGVSVDVLVNNAGWFPACAFEELTYQHWRAVMAVNLDSVFLMTQNLLPLIRAGRCKRVVNIGSSSIFNGPSDYAPYVSAKAGVVGLTRCLARMLGPEGINVNVITPGLSDTPGARGVFVNGEIGASARQRALPRVQDAEDVVGAMVFLSSRDSAFITGQIINVDGGQRFY